MKNLPTSEFLPVGIMRCHCCDAQNLSWNVSCWLCEENLEFPEAKKEVTLLQGQQHRNDVRAVVTLHRSGGWEDNRSLRGHGSSEVAAATRSLIKIYNDIDAMGESQGSKYDSAV